MSWAGAGVANVDRLAAQAVTPGRSGQPVRAGTYPLSLDEALAAAREGSAAAAVARSWAEAAQHAARSAGSYRWPRVALEAGLLRSNDPVAAFGARLRQGRFGQEDFDPARLNDPAAITDWTLGVGATWQPVDMVAGAARRAALDEAEAAAFGAEWAERAAAFTARVGYMEALGAARAHTAAEVGLQAARANEAVVTRRVAEGALTGADALLARAAVESARSAVVGAERARADARDRLAVTLGWPEGAVPVLTDTTFAESDGGTGAELPDARPDLLADLRSVDAARARHEQAARARLPTLTGMVRAESHTSDPSGGYQGTWTVGVQVALPLFTGFSVEASRAAALARYAAVERTQRQRVREAQAEIAEARRGVTAARQRQSAARAALAAADEAARLVRLRFTEGMATTADLLSAEATASALRSESVNVDLEAHLAAALLAFLTDGNDR